MEDKELTIQDTAITTEEVSLEELPQQHDQQEEVAQVAQPVVIDATEKKAQENFRKLREKAERVERERDQAYQLLQQQMLYNQQQSADAKTMADRRYQQEPELDANDYTNRAWVEQKLTYQQQQMVESQRRLSDQIAEMELRLAHTDFSEVVTPENIARLREEYPEVASSLAANPNQVEKAKAAYKIIKKLGFNEEREQETNYEATKQKIHTNAQKPRPVVSSPLSMANDYENGRLTEADMKKERMEMERAIANR